MKFFVDTADTAEIKELSEAGLLDGVTTNPTLIAKSGRNMLEVIREICDLVEGSVSAEVVSSDYAAMLAEGKKLVQIAPNVTVKVPLTMDGLRVCKALTSEGMEVNVTLCFSVNQALLEDKAGATYVSPFIGRLDDIGMDGMQLIADILEVYANYPYLQTQVLAASIRHPVHVMQAAQLGADVATMPPAVIRQLFHHPLTEKGLAAFTADWAKTGQSIL